MKTWIAGGLAVLLLAGAPAVAAGIGGIWKTQANDDGNVAFVQFSDCGGKFCGQLIKSIGPDGKEIASRNTGRNLVWDMVDQGDGSFKSGRIWDPGADKTFKSKMSINGNQLKVSGCIAILCKSQTWVRVK